MKNKSFLLITLLIAFTALNAQTVIHKPENLRIDIEDTLKNKILNSLDSLFFQVDQERVDERLLDQSDQNVFNLTKGVLSWLSNETTEKDSIPNFYKRQLINMYPVSVNEYFISIAYMGIKNDEIPVLKTISNLIASKNNEKIVFSIPLNYLTRRWQTKTVGNVTYYFKGELNLERAKLFDKKNNQIAGKFGLKPEKFDFYMTENYQEVKSLLGYKYSLMDNGKTENGAGVYYNTIFAIMHNEDFSHDVFHYYSEQIHENRNWIAEEGIAYSWGNAYYAKQNGEMIELQELVDYLKKYMQNNSEISLWKLYEEDTKIFNALAKEISVRSTIAALLCDEIERQKGMEGIKLIISCGKGLDNYIKTLTELIAINKDNFDFEVKKLIDKYEQKTNE